jgi:hypothetical protein
VSNAEVLSERDQILRIEQFRWKFLLELFRLHNELPAGRVQSTPAEVVGDRIGLTNERELELVYTYLKDAGLLKYMAMGPTLAITKAGIDEVHQGIKHPDRETRHLPPFNITHNVISNVIHGGVHASTVQQGTTSSSQTVENTSIDWAQLQQILSELRPTVERFPEEDRREALADIEVVEAQTRSSRPKIEMVKMALASLRALVANTAGNVAAAPLIDWLHVHHWM